MVIERMRKILNRYDPIGIYDEEAGNFDEYDAEIKRIIIKFKISDTKDHFLTEVYNVFVNMFSEKDAGKKAHYIDLVDELYELLKKVHNK